MDELNNSKLLRVNSNKVKPIARGNTTQGNKKQKWNNIFGVVLYNIYWSFPCGTLEFIL